MAFETVQDLSCDTVIQLGGTNRETGKANQAQIEGYFLGSKKIESRKSKTVVRNRMG